MALSNVGVKRGASPLARLRGVFYGWWLVGLSIVSLAMVNGSASHGLGVFFVALERQFGWSRTALSGAFAMSRAEGALLGPVEGFLTDRFGTRNIVRVGYMVLGSGFMLFSFTRSIPGFYLAFMVVALGMGLSSFLPMMAAMNNWFVRKRGMAIAIGGMGIYLGGSLVPFLAWGVNTVGWQTVTFLLGVAFWMLAFPMTQLIRNRPEDYGQLPDGDSPAALPRTPPGEVRVGVSDDGGLTALQALHTPAFWFIAGSAGLTAMIMGVMSVHIVPLLTDAGLSLEMAGTVVAAYTFMSMASRVLGGLLGDRFPKPLVIFGFVTLQAVGVLSATLVQDTRSAFLFAVLFGVGWGGARPVITAIRGDYFGRRAFATIFGLSQLPMSAMSVAAPLFAGYMYDTMGSYTLPFVIFACFNFLGGCLILLAKNPSLPRPKLVDLAKSM